MKNFAMPEQISPTLELDELERLKHSLEENVSKEMVEAVMAELPLTINSTPKIRAEWVEKLSAVLEKRFDERTVKNIRQGCYCNENGKLEEIADSLRQLYLSLDQNLLSFVETMNANGAGWFIRDNQLYTKMFICQCPMLEAAENSNSLTWCHCTQDITKNSLKLFLKGLLMQKFYKSIRQGFDFCLMRITIQ